MGVPSEASNVFIAGAMTAVGVAAGDFQPTGHLWMLPCPSAGLPKVQAGSGFFLATSGPTKLPLACPVPAGMVMTRMPSNASTAMTRVPSADSDTDSLHSSSGSFASGAQFSDSWHLVWCHERCHKQESAATRSLLAQASPHVTCLKKADKYAAWLPQAWRRPYVLLTDWREAKPCVQALLEHPQECQPMLTLVLAQNEKQFERASAWASTRGSSVHVFQEDSEVRDFLNSHMPLAMAPRPRRAEAVAALQVVRTQQPTHQELGTEILAPLLQKHSTEELVALLTSTQPECYDD